MSPKTSEPPLPPPPASCGLWLQLLDQKENLALQVQQLTQDLTLQQQKNSAVQSQMRELLSERDQVALRPRLRPAGTRAAPPESGSGSSGSELLSGEGEGTRSPVALLDRLDRLDRLLQQESELERAESEVVRSAPGPSRRTCPETKPRP